MDVVTRWGVSASIRVELGVGDSKSPTTIGEWGVSHWGQPDALWSGVEPLWVDVTPHMRRVETSGGADYTVGRFGVGQCQLVGENESGWATLLAPNPLNVRVRRAVRVTGTVAAGVYAGVGFDLFRGYIDALTPTYLADGRPGVQLDCVDGLALFADNDPLALAAPVGAGELSGARVHRVLDRVGWPQAWRSIDPGQATMEATDLSRNYADELGVVADSEGGSLFVNGAGVVCFRDRDWWRTTSTTPLFTIGNVPGSDVCPSGWQTGQSMNEVVSMVALANAGGTARNYVAADTYAAVGPSTFRRFDLICADPEQLDILGARILAVRGTLHARVQGATVSMLAEGTALADLLPFLTYGVRVRAAYDDGSTIEFDQPMIVTRLAHNVDADADWVTVIGLENAAPYTPAEPWGAARWNAGTWSSA